MGKRRWLAEETMRATTSILLLTAIGCASAPREALRIAGHYSWRVGYEGDALVIDDDGQFEWRFGNRLLFPVSGRWTRTEGLVHLTAANPGRTNAIEPELRVVLRDGAVFLVPPQNLAEFVSEGPRQDLCLSPSHLDIPRW